MLQLGLEPGDQLWIERVGGLEFTDKWTGGKNAAYRDIRLACRTPNGCSKGGADRRYPDRASFNYGIFWTDNLTESKLPLFQK